MNDEILKPGWQLCTVLDAPRAINGKTFYLQGRADPLGFFEAVALSDLEDKWIRLPAPCQRHFFGCVPFGKKAVKVKTDGIILLFWTSGFGQDWEYQTLRYNPSERAFVYATGWEVWRKLETKPAPKCSRQGCAISYPHNSH